MGYDKCFERGKIIMFEEYEEDNFLVTMSEFIKSSNDLATAAKLCEDDPIKQDMIAFVHSQFEEMRARSEGVRLLVERQYPESKDFILQELKEITKHNYDMATKIKSTLEGLL